MSTPTPPSGQPNTAPRPGFTSLDRSDFCPVQGCKGHGTVGYVPVGDHATGAEQDMEAVLVCEDCQAIYGQAIYVRPDRTVIRSSGDG